MKRRSFFLLFLIFFVFLSGKEIKILENDNPFYPLKKGAFWVYQSEDGTIESRWVVKKVYLSGKGEKSAILAWYIKGMPSNIPPMEKEITVSKCNVYERWLPYEPVKGGGRVEFSSGRILILPSPKFLAIKKGWRGENVFKTSTIISRGVQENLSDYSILGWKKVGVPYGKFLAVGIKERFVAEEGEAVTFVPPMRRRVESFSEDNVYWYAPFIGMIKGLGFVLKGTSFKRRKCSGFFYSTRGDVFVNGEKVKECKIYDLKELEVRVSEGSYTELYKGDDSIVRLGSGTEVKFNQVCSFKEGKELVSMNKILLFLGKMYLKVKEVLGSDSSIYFEGRRLAGGVRGTEFLFEVFKKGEKYCDRVRVFEGEVEVKDKKTKKDYMLRKGEEKVICEISN